MSVLYIYILCVAVWILFNCTNSRCQNSENQPCWFTKNAFGLTVTIFVCLYEYIVFMTCNWLFYPALSAWRLLVIFQRQLHRICWFSFFFFFFHFEVDLAISFRCDHVLRTFHSHFDFYPAQTQRSFVIATNATYFNSREWTIDTKIIKYNLLQPTAKSRECLACPMFSSSFSCWFVSS